MQKLKTNKLIKNAIIFNLMLTHITYATDK